jgi:hypothetical protein
MHSSWFNQSSRYRARRNPGTHFCASPDIETANSHANRIVVMDSGLAPSARPGMTVGQLGNLTPML